MKLSGPFEYKTFNLGFLLLFDSYFYFATLNIKDSIKFLLKREIGFFFKNPLENISEENYKNFLEKNEFKKFKYEGSYQISLNFDKMWQHNILLEYQNTKHKFIIRDRNNFESYERCLKEYFNNRLLVNK